jgi:hypothetical protein
MLAQFVAGKLISCWWKDWTGNGCSEKISRLQELRILDPACGDGALLEAIVHEFSERTSEEMIETLCGVDVDARAAAKARWRISAWSQRRFGFRKTPKIINANALLPDRKVGTEQGWEALKLRFGALNGFDLLIANPPWGATIRRYRHKLSTNFFTLLRKQFDTSDLFLELGLSLLKPGGYLAYIVPDSLFSFERTDLRRILVQNTEIQFLGRFGEKFFGGINRACAVLICKKTEPSKLSKVQCMRLTPEFRKAILRSHKTFGDAERELSHSVPQSRFAKNAEFRFDLDLRREENTTFAKLRAAGLSFRDLIFGTRGVELSKHGRAQKCSACLHWFPLQQRPKYICLHCGYESKSAEADVEAIITREKAAGYLPILVGECINRYRLSAPYWIDPTKKGINYKPRSVYSEPKLLVRKTGIGISATMDYSGALTNQVVYIFNLRPEYREAVPLELLLAILNSRAMYYYVAKAHGETEWRSHPYVTQQQILQLPLPDLRRLSSPSAKRIGAELRATLRQRATVSDTTDADVEGFVAGAFGLGATDYARIYRTLSSVEQLLPVQALLNINARHIFPRSS